VDANGIVVAGHTSALNGYVGVSGRQASSFEAVGGNTAGTGLAIFGFSTATVPRTTVNFNKSNSATLGTHAIVSDTTVLGALHFSGSDGTDYIPAASIQAFVDGTPGTNDMPGRLVFSTTADGASSPTERMRIDNAGRVGIGGAPSAGQSLVIYKSITGSAYSSGIYSGGQIQSDVSTRADAFLSGPSTAASITVSSVNHYYADQVYKGSGAAVTNQYGFNASGALTGATNNYGFYSNIASGTGRYGFYSAGSADNYFAGVVISGNYAEVTTNSAAGTGLRIKTPSGSGSAGILQFTNNPVTAQWAAITSPAANVLTFNDGGNVEKFRLDSSGNLVVTGTGGLGYGTGSGGAVTQATSRTTGVTLNKTNGAITLVSAAGSAAYQTFTVTNSTVAATDVIHVSQKSGTDKYIILVTAVAAGSFAITFATTGGTTTEQPVFNFAVLKAVAA